MGRTGFLAASVALLLLAVSLGRCDAKRTLKVVSILVSEPFRLLLSAYRDIQIITTRIVLVKDSKLEYVSVKNFCARDLLPEFKSPLNSSLPSHPLPS